jgi:hypothetical protein
VIGTDSSGVVAVVEVDVYCNNFHCCYRLRCCVGSFYS